MIEVLVQASLKDGMLNALLEAMACEKTVIGMSVGGMLDILEEGKNGMLVDINNADMLAEKICILLDNVKEREQLCKSAQETILSRFTLEKELEANLPVHQRLGLRI